MFNQIKKRILKKKEKGFTLVETLIAISILMISVAAPLSLAAKGIQAANLAKQQIVAYYLAQDAYEVIKNITDTNKLAVKTYAEGGIIAGDLNNICVSNNCRIDTLTGKIEMFTPGQKIKYSDSMNVYGFDPAGASSYFDTIYSRYFKIIKTKDTGVSIDEIKVLITMEWNIPYIGLQSYTLEGHITNW